tara:strand:- start:35 stop:319 length:285 start_codon:yes stop_codon:yes gene_type:complete
VNALLAMQMPAVTVGAWVKAAVRAMQGIPPTTMLLLLVLLVFLARTSRRLAMTIVICVLRERHMMPIPCTPSFSGRAFWKPTLALIVRQIFITT